MEGYDAVAETYARKIGAELSSKPLDRALLDCLGELAGPLGPICDLGCGPGQVAAYLHPRHDVLGIDLSEKMLEEARKLHPGVRFQAGSILSIPLPDASLGGVAAFYSLIHVERQRMPQALQEIARVLKPGGRVLASFHVGEQTQHLDEWWETPVNLDFHFFLPEEMQGWLGQAGFAVEFVTVRSPYAPEIEHQSQRAYLMARKPLHPEE